jgi:hypothetical protein
MLGVRIVLQLQSHPSMWGETARSTSPCNKVLPNTPVVDSRTLCLSKVVQLPCEQTMFTTHVQAACIIYETHETCTRQTIVIAKHNTGHAAHWTTPDPSQTSVTIVVVVASIMPRWCQPRNLDVDSRHNVISCLFSSSSSSMTPPSFNHLQE